MKRFLRTGVAAACRASGVLVSAERRRRHDLTVLCYHRVLPAGQKASLALQQLAVTPETFQCHCRTLARHFDVMPLSEAVDAWTASKPHSRPVAAITFDDGYRDNFEYAAPILAETGLRATFYIVAGLAGTDEVPWHDSMAESASILETSGRLGQVLAESGAFSRQNVLPHQGLRTTPRQVVAEAKKLAPDRRRDLLDALRAAAPGDPATAQRDRIMTWRQLAELAEAGHEIGSHGNAHEILPLLEKTALDLDVCDSRRILEEGIGQPVRSFCYPNGDHDDRVVRAVEEAGYASAVTVVSGTNSPGQRTLRLKRFFIDEERLTGTGGILSDALLRMELCGLAARLFLRGKRTASHP